MKTLGKVYAKQPVTSHYRVGLSDGGSFTVDAYDSNDAEVKAFWHINHPERGYHGLKVTEITLSIKVGK